MKRVHEVRMKRPLQSFLARVLFFLGVTLAAANVLFLLFSESVRREVGSGALVAFLAAGIVVIITSLCLDRFPRGERSQSP